MPRGDGTGPEGKGPGTGWGRGRCSGNSQAEASGLQTGSSGALRRRAGWRRAGNGLRRGVSGAGRFFRRQAARSLPDTEQD